MRTRSFKSKKFLSPERQVLRNNRRLQRIWLGSNRLRNVIALVSLLASLLLSGYYTYNIQKTTLETAGSLQPLPSTSERPRVVQEETPTPAPPKEEKYPPANGLRGPPPILQTVRARSNFHSQVQPAGANLQSELPSSIHKLFVEPIGDHFAEALRAELYKQIGDRISIVTSIEDADAILGGFSMTSGVSNHFLTFHRNASVSLCLYNKTRETILWSSSANDRIFTFYRVGFGGETKAAERLVRDLKNKYFRAQ